MKLNTNKIKEFITEPNLGVELRPLLLFNGNLSEGTAVSRFNFLRAAMDAEVPTLTEMTKLSVIANDDAHLCGFHAKYGWDRMGMQGFLGRMLQSPSVLDKAQGMKDYIHWVIEQTPHAFAYKLTPISEFALRARRSWRVLYHASVEPMAEHYPFISGKPTSDHELVLAVEALVPKYLPPDTRADVCQDMIVSILTGEITLENLRDRTKPYIKKVFKDAPSKYGHLSLDAPIDFGEGKSRTLGEMLV